MTGRLGRAAASAAPAPHRPANPPPQHCNANTQGVHCIQKGFRRRSSRPGDEWRQSTSSKVCLLEAALCEVGLCLLNLDTSCLGLQHSGQFLGDLPAARQRWRPGCGVPRAQGRNTAFRSVPNTEWHVGTDWKGPVCLARHIHNPIDEIFHHRALCPDDPPAHFLNMWHCLQLALCRCKVAHLLGRHCRSGHGGHVTSGTPAPHLPC